MTTKLDKILSIPEVAAIAGWHPRRMRRHLLKLNEEVHGMLLRNVGTREMPRWTVTLAALQRVAPQWFTSPDSVEARLDSLESETKHLRQLVLNLSKAVHELTAA